MKHFAQHGFGDGEKTLAGLKEGLIQGVMFSPKDLKPTSTAKRMSEIHERHPDAHVLLDPQMYVALYASNPNVKLGRLPDWEFFQGHTRARLEDPGKVDEVLRRYFAVLRGMPTTAIVAPNLYISRSFDSIEAAIAKCFIRRTAELYKETGENKPVFATIAVSREALLQQAEFALFLNDITALDAPPDGFYVIVGARSPDARSDILDADVIANWMMLNHALRINGFRVINGYSDILSPLLGIAGAWAGASGWWSNLRVFSLDRFLPLREGGRLPIKRYLSVLLMNRITYIEKEAFSGFVPAVANGLSHDAEYDPEPTRDSEVLQSWEALGRLASLLIRDSPGESISAVWKAIDAAESAYNLLKATVDIDPKSDDEHLAAIREGLHKFIQRAEL